MDVAPFTLNVKGCTDPFSPFTNIQSEEGLLKAWRICSKVKDALENGSRLENLSWRLWFRHQRQNQQRQQHGPMAECSEVTWLPVHDNVQYSPMKAEHGWLDHRPVQEAYHEQMTFDNKGLSDFGADDYHSILPPPPPPPAFASDVEMQEIFETRTTSYWPSYEHHHDMLLDNAPSSFQQTIDTTLANRMASFTMHTTTSFPSDPIMTTEQHLPKDDPAAVYVAADVPPSHDSTFIDPFLGTRRDHPPRSGSSRSNRSHRWLPITMEDSSPSGNLTSTNSSHDHSLYNTGL